MIDLTAVFLGCTVWLPIAVWVISLVHWTIAGEIDVVSGFLGVCIALGLGAVVVKPPAPALAPIAYLAVLVTIVMYVPVRAVLNRRELKSIDVHAVDRAYEALAQRPGNPLAVFRLAQSVYNLGMIGHGVALADSVLAGMPARLFTEEHRILDRWKRAGVPPDTLQPIACVDCHTPCPPGTTHCPNCGARFLLDRARGRVLPQGLGRKLISAWIALVAVLAGIPASTALPPVASLAAILALLAVAGGVVVLAFRPPKGSVA